LKVNNDPAKRRVRMRNARLSCHKITYLANFQFLCDQTVIAIEIGPIIVLFWNSVADQPSFDRHGKLLAVSDLGIEGCRSWLTTCRESPTFERPRNVFLIIDCNHAVPT